MFKSVKQQLECFNEHYGVLKHKGKYNRVFIFCDYICAALKYGASASDYFDFEFYDKKSNARKPFACYKLRRRFLNLANDHTKKDFFDEKPQFLKTFKDFIGREWLDTSSCSFEEFEGFVSRHGSFIAKPANLSCGKGVHKVDANDHKDLKALFGSLKEEKALIEELIVQHKDIGRLNPGSVNTLRIAAIHLNGRTEVIGAVLRCGSNKGPIDNFSAGGFASKVDWETGTVVSDGINQYNDRYEKHPDTNVLFHGFKIPNWDKVVALIESAAKVVPGARYIGWDVAVTENGAVLVEGNFEGMFHVLQAPANKGIKKHISDLVNELSAGNK